MSSFPAIGNSRSVDSERDPCDLEVILREQEARAPSVHQGASARPPVVNGVVLGSVVGPGEDGAWLVEFPGNPAGKPRAARALMQNQELEGRTVALMFDGGDIRKPLIMGPLEDPCGSVESERGNPGDKSRQFKVQADDETITLTADREIMLSCGKASITLTRAGKILLKGTYVLSRSSGLNRIKGGAVHIN